MSVLLREAAGQMQHVQKAQFYSATYFDLVLVHENLQLKNVAMTELCPGPSPLKAKADIVPSAQQRSCHMSEFREILLKNNGKLPQWSPEQKTFIKVSLEGDNLIFLWPS